MGVDGKKFSEKTHMKINWFKINKNNIKSKINYYLILYPSPYALSIIFLYLKQGFRCKDCEHTFGNCSCNKCKNCQFNSCLCQFKLKYMGSTTVYPLEDQIIVRNFGKQLLLKIFSISNIKNLIYEINKELNRVNFDETDEHLIKTCVRELWNNIYNHENQLV